MTVKEKSDSTREEMLSVNRRQKEFYESRFDALAAQNGRDERAAGKVTNLWTRARRRMKQAANGIGLDEQIRTLHQAWLSDIENAAVLDLGCFSGNPLSLWIAERCRDYTGIDLSEQATARLNEELEARGLHHARAYAHDFLNNHFEDGQFDYIYALGVMHHFQDLEVLLQEMHRVLKPGGKVISVDPLMTEPINRLLRALYRPFQSDKDWEWPFTRRTFRLIDRHFDIREIQGLQGFSKLGYPLMALPGLDRLGRRVSLWGLEHDNRKANRLGLHFYLCWQVTMLVEKRS